MVSMGNGNATLTYHPLDPDHIIGAGLWTEVLQPTAEVVPHPLALFPQVGLGFGQKVLSHVHHVHHPEEWQEQALGDPSDASATVQGTGSPRFVRSFLKHRRAYDPRGTTTAGPFSRVPGSRARLLHWPIMGGQVGLLLREAASPSRGELEKQMHNLLLL